jgi:hypothetical protein
LSRGREEYHTYNKKMKANWIGYVLCRNCLIKHIIEGKLGGGLEVKGRGERRRKQLLADWMTLRNREDTGKLKVAALSHFV